jgi:hypothetical protein
VFAYFPLCEVFFFVVFLLISNGIGLERYILESGYESVSDVRCVLSVRGGGLDSGGGGRGGEIGL